MSKKLVSKVWRAFIAESLNGGSAWLYFLRPSLSWRKESITQLAHLPEGAHTLRAVLREAGRLAGRQALVNTVIYWSPHIESRNPACSSFCSQCVDSNILPCLPKPACQPACQLLAKLLSVCEHPDKYLLLVLLRTMKSIYTGL